MNIEWRGVSELPELMDEGRSDDVLVSFGDGTCAVLFYDYESIGWFDAYGSEWCGYVSPMYWMPLPDAPPMGAA